MWFIWELYSVVYDTAVWCYDRAGECEEIEIFGWHILDWLGDPLRGLAWRLWDASGFILALSDWLDNLDWRLGDFISWDNIKDGIYGRWPQLWRFFDDPSWWIWWRITAHFPIMAGFFDDPLHWIKWRTYENWPWMYPMFDDPRRWVMEKVEESWPDLGRILHEPWQWIKDTLYTHFPATWLLLDDPSWWIKWRITNTWPVFVGFFDDPVNWLKWEIYKRYIWIYPLFDDPRRWVEEKVRETWPGLWDVYLGWQDFSRDPAGYVWERLVPGLLKRAETWLNERWDQPAP